MVTIRRRFVKKPLLDKRPSPRAMAREGSAVSISSGRKEHSFPPIMSYRAGSFRTSHDPLVSCRDGSIKGLRAYAPARRQLLSPGVPRLPMDGPPPFCPNRCFPSTPYGRLRHWPGLTTLNYLTTNRLKAQGFFHVMFFCEKPNTIGGNSKKKVCHTSKQSFWNPPSSREARDYGGARKCVPKCNLGTSGMDFFMWFFFLREGFRRKRAAGGSFFLPRWTDRRP